MYFYSCLSWKMFHLYRIVYILSFNLWDCVPLVFLVPVFMTDSLIVRIFRSVYLSKMVVILLKYMYLYTFVSRTVRLYRTVFLLFGAFIGL